MATKTDKNSTAVATTRWQDLSQKERERLVSDAQRGDKQAMYRVMEGAAENEHLRNTLLNLPQHAREYLVGTVYGTDNHLMRQMLVTKATMLEDQLKADGKPSALERMLIERVATCWLAAYLAELETERVMQSGATLTKAAYYEQRRDRAHARHLSAMLALAKVRRLLAPVVAQVNIAQPGAQQLNIATPAGATPTQALP
ncbi:MAG: hypothetical protein ACXWQR_20775 [Ktedonobacterales bacterium]